jgi:hypothetical protein
MQYGFNFILNQFNFERFKPNVTTIPVLPGLGGDKVRGYENKGNL